MKSTISFLINLGVFIIGLISSLAIFIYMALLIEKINSPHFKNLQYREFAWIGLALVPIALLDVLIVRRFFRMLKRKLYKEPHGWR